MYWVVQRAKDRRPPEIRNSDRRRQTRAIQAFLPRRRPARATSARETAETFFTRARSANQGLTGWRRRAHSVPCFSPRAVFGCRCRCCMVRAECVPGCGAGDLSETHTGRDKSTIAAVGPSFQPASSPHTTRDLPARGHMHPRPHKLPGPESSWHLSAGLHPGHRDTPSLPPSSGQNIKEGEVSRDNTTTPFGINIPSPNTKHPTTPAKDREMTRLPTDHSERCFSPPEAQTTEVSA